MKQLLVKINEFKGSLIILISWIFVSEISNNSVITLLNQVLRFFLYPLNLLIYGTDFSKTTIPSSFFILVPLFFIFLIGFLIIISTEN